MPKTILFVIAPEAGHVLPTIPVAKRLRAMGYEVLYLTSPHFAGYIRRQGLAAEEYISGKAETVRLSPPCAVPKAGLEIWRETWASPRHTNHPFYSRLVEVAERYTPGLTVVDRVFRLKPKKVIADFCKLWPVLILSTYLLHWQQESSFEDLPCLVLCPGTLEPPELRSRLSNVIYAEPSINFCREDRDFDWKGFDRSRPIVLCTFGSQTSRHRQLAERFRTLFEVARNLPGIQFIMSIGHGSTPFEPCDKPSNVVAYPVLPQLELLERVQLFITHGGLGGVKEAVYMGVPMLVWPLAYDQFYNAGQLERLGVARRVLEGQETATGITQHIDEILNSRKIRVQLKKLQVEFQETEARPIAAQTIAARVEA